MYGWGSSTICNILDKREYLGHTINFKTRKHFKDKKSHYVPEDEWTIFENTHEAIIDQETFDLAQKVRSKVRRYPDGWGDVAPLTGLLYCADCGGKMYVHRFNNGKRISQYTCSKYSKIPVGTLCKTQHRINESVVLELVKDLLKAIAEYAKHERAEFVRVVQEAQSSQQTAEVKKQRTRLATAKQRISELEVLLCKIYEDNILGKLSDSRYATLDAQYEKEQKELTAEISTLEKAISDYEKHEKDADRFIALIDKYENFDELTITMLNEFVEKILVHERDRKGSIQTTQEVEIYFNFVGRFVPPKFAEVELTPEELEEIRKREERKDRLHQNFVSKGMCCDFAIHDPDPPGHNPHCHFMLTMRAIDENGKWLPKSRKVYDLDENGERIKLPSGRWKSHKEDTVDWNEQYHAEEWRHGWEVVQNKYLELAGSPERIDMRSYERQGLDIIPTVHMGTAVSALERKGIATNIGNLNRDIKAANRMMNAIRSTIKNLRDWIADILEATKEVLAENEAAKKNASPNLAVLLRDYLNLRKAERSEWSRYGQQKGTTDDLKTISQATVYLQRHELFTLEDLDIALQGVSEKATAIREDMQTAANRMKAITTIQNAVADCEKHKAVHDKYIKIGWKIRKEAYAESHKDELTAFNKAYRTLKKHGGDLNVDLKALQKEYDDLKISHTNLKAQLAAVNEELKPMKDIRYWVGKVLSPEQTATKQPEPKHSLKERLLYEQEQKKQVQKAPKQKKQDMEL